jgi:flagellar assembly factor FliW
MRLETARFGGLEVPEESVLDFPAGILGFPEMRRCCLLPYGENHGLRWLQSVEDPGLLFLTLEPYLVFPDYEVDLPEWEAEALGLEVPGEAAVLTLVTICAESAVVTTNLLAPVVINTRTRRARQVVMEDGRYLTQHLIGGEVGEGLSGG